MVSSCWILRAWVPLQRPHLHIPTHWGLGFKYAFGRDKNIQSVAKNELCQCSVKYKTSLVGAWCLVYSFSHSCDFQSCLSVDSTQTRISLLLLLSAADLMLSPGCGPSLITGTCLQAGLLISIPPDFSSSVNGTPICPLHHLGSKSGSHPQLPPFPSTLHLLPPSLWAQPLKCKNMKLLVRMEE